MTNPSFHEKFETIPPPPGEACMENGFLKGKQIWNSTPDEGVAVDLDHSFFSTRSSLSIAILVGYPSPNFKIFSIQPRVLSSRWGKRKRITTFGPHLVVRYILSILILFPPLKCNEKFSPTFWPKKSCSG